MRRICAAAVVAGMTILLTLSAWKNHTYLSKTEVEPEYVFSYAENQEALTEWLGAQQIAGYAGAWHRSAGETLERIGAWCLKAQKDPGLRRQCYETERGLIDGLGAARIAQILITAGKLGIK